MRNTPSLPRFSVRLVLAIGAIHGCFSWTMACFVERQYPNRILNVRAIEPTEWKARNQIVASYFDAGRRDGRPLIGFVGSSFSWGYPYSQEASLSQALVEARPDRRVVNAGVLGLGLDGVHQLTKIAELQDCRFETLFVEIPVVNEMAHLAGQAELKFWKGHFRGARDDVDFVRGTTHFRWMLRNPASLDVLTVFAEEALLDDASTPQPFAEPAAGYFISRAAFERIHPTYVLKVAATLESARGIADRVVAYPSLVCLSAGKLANYDAEALRDQIEATVKACEACEGLPGVVAIRPPDRFLTDRTLYQNITHLNVRGNAEFGRWLASELDLAENGARPDLGSDSTTSVAAASVR